MEPESLELEENRNEVQELAPNGHAHDGPDVLTLEEIANLAAEEGQPAETLMNVVALIAKRFESDVCSAYLLEPDRANLVLAATVGLRRECIGSLRMAIHEGLGRFGRGTGAARGRGAGAQSPAFQVLPGSRRR
jgi:signal transduction protein with GAF and PtsI domain